jgi:hypothetical protein
LISWNVHQLTTLNVNWDGALQDWYERAGVTFSLRRQTALTIDGSLAESRLYEHEFGRARRPGRHGAFAGPDSRRGRARALRIALDSTPFASCTLGAAWRVYAGEFDYDFGNGPRFPRVSPAALAEPRAPLDPGVGRGHDLDLYADLQPAPQLQVSLEFTRTRLRRDDTRRVALDQQIASLHATYQFTRSGALRLRADYDTLDRSLRSQALLAFTPSPGTALYVGWNHDATLDGWSPLTGRYRPGFGLNARTFFFKASYLLRKQL